MEKWIFPPQLLARASIGSADHIASAVLVGYQTLKRMFIMSPSWTG